jgi:TRAP-type C4-dicarboxylate transport system substrate-binding protein
MKRVFSLLLAAALMLSLAACGGGGTSSAGTSSNTAPAETAPAETASPGNSSDTTVYNLKLAHHDPANGAKGQFLQQLCDDITSESDGRIKFTVYPGATLCSAADAYESLTSGVCDMIWGAPGFESWYVWDICKFFFLPDDGGAWTIPAVAST